MSEHPDECSEEDGVFLASIAHVLSDAVERRAAEAEIAQISAARGRLVAQAIDAEDDRDERGVDTSRHQDRHDEGRRP